MFHLDLLWILFICLLVISGCFSASETAMMAINRYRLAHWARQGQQRARMVQKMLRRPERLLGVILIGNTFANVLASAVATVLILRWYGESGVIISTLLVTVLLLIFSEVLPKTLAARNPGKVSMLAVWPLFILLKILNPLVWLVSGFVSLLLRACGIRKNLALETDALSAAELHSAVYASQQVPEERQQMLLRILELEATTAEEVMVPRSSMVAIDLNWPQEKIEKKIKCCNYRIVPLYEGNLEKSCGMLMLKHAWREILRGKTCDAKLLKKLANTAYFIPEATPIGRQIIYFQKNEQSIAQVVDEYGQVLGLVSLRDIINAITGQWNYGEGRQRFGADLTAAIEISGKLSVRELNRRMQWSLPTSQARSVAGLVVEHLQVLPDGPFCIKIGNYIFEAIEVNAHQIIRLNVRVLKIYKD